MMQSSISNCRVSTAISYTLITLRNTKSMRQLCAYTLQNMQNPCQATWKKTHVYLQIWLNWITFSLILSFVLFYIWDLLLAKWSSQEEKCTIFQSTFPGFSWDSRLQNTSSSFFITGHRVWDINFLIWGLTKRYFAFCLFINSISLTYFTVYREGKMVSFRGFITE